jgi:hypothetical protein
LKIAVRKISSILGFLFSAPPQHLIADISAYRHRISLFAASHLCIYAWLLNANFPKEWHSIMRKTVHEWLVSNPNGTGMAKKEQHVAH